jgi:ATP-binding cassette subfamily B protein
LLNGLVIFAGMTQLATLNKYFWKYRWLLVLGILFVILTNYFRIISPQLTGHVINTVVNALHPEAKPVAAGTHDWLTGNLIQWFDAEPFQYKILYAAMVLLALAVISGFFMFLMRQTIIVMSRHIEFDQKNEVFAHYQQLDAGFYKTHATGDLMNRITEDVSRVRMYTGPAIMYFINLAAVIGFSLYFMIRSDWRLTLYSLMPLPVLAIAIYFVNSIINRKSEKIQALLSDLTTHAQESYSGIRVIKSFVQEKSMSAFFSRQADLYKQEALSLARTEAIYFPSMALLIGLSTLISILVGGLDVVNQVPGASVGKIAEFVMYIQMLTFPVSAIGWTASMTQRAIASQKRINEFLQTKPAIQNNPDPVKPTLSGDILLQDASFTYAHTGIEAIRGLTLHIKPGQKVAIVGKTGSGKSTLAQLLLRQFDLSAGSILLDGIPINRIDLDALHRNICYVPQDVFLFSDSIENNIRFGNEAADSQRVKAAARDAGILREIEQLPDGFGTIVGERGVTLSGGQKQRISIARALAKDASILLLDDCLSAVDSKTENEIVGHLQDALQGKTALIITHRIFSSFSFDQILVLDDGRVAEAGTREELLQRNGIFADLYRRQQQQESLN